ncbi:NAD(P)-dependent oxidoreductase [Methylocystis sp. B8]|uniref:NAD-dependent epimerase/dehydratase family protein n=1 Tax=Methylocystis sp. B8 TaxID=544938 RepID=UPI0010FE996B|nr:NAD(P)-dependent oxidoreductase [Methylocystis sp. B8]TLG77624.1 NAD(P)-dependent oxidoreductase [Methylocystis sp. B8]
MTSPNAATVLVTGGLGFIGRHVSQHFKSQGNRVVGIGHGNATEAIDFGLSRWQSGEVSRQSLEALAERIDLIVHCAGSSLVAASFADPDAEFRKSVGSAIEVLEFARHQARSPRIVVLSSAAVYGIVTQLPISEDAPLDPISPYGKSKLAIEQRCQRYGRDYGLEIAIVRLFSVYGLGLRKQLFWDACQKFAKGDGRFGGTGNERRDWLHVRDAVQLIDAVAKQASVAVPIVNGGTGNSMTIRDALMHLRGLWPASVPEISFSGEARQGDPPGYEADMARAYALAWAPTQEFAEGLADYVSWASSLLT